MAGIVAASAYSDNEVAYVAWRVDGRLDGCLGFEIVREYLDEAGDMTEAVPLAAYVAFEGQSNPDWTAQNTSLWPVQKFSWRDLTLRKRRDGAKRRPSDVRVRYAVRPVCAFRPDLPKVEPRPEGDPPGSNHYQGAPVPLSYLADAVRTAPIRVTSNLPPFFSTFTNGMLSGQWLVRALEADDGRVTDGELKGHLVTPGDRLRNYLSGDVWRR